MTLFRGLLAFPALIVWTLLYSVVALALLLGWPYALATGRMPRGLRDVGATSIRYGAQTLAYLLFVTDRYPYSCPAVEGWRAPEPAPAWLPLLPGARDPAFVPELARRIRFVRTLRWLALAAGAAVWLVAAGLLLRDSFPSGLDLPPVDVDAVFGAEHVDEAARFDRFFQWSFVLSQVVLVVTLVVYARKGVALTRESAAGRIGTGMLLGMLGLALVWLVQLPFGVANLWWARRHDVTELGYGEWFLTGFIELGVIFLVICLELLIVMAIAGPLGDNWWLPGALVFIVLVTTVTYTSPYILAAGTITDPLEDPALIAAANEYAREQGLEKVPIYVEEVSSYTDQANAYAAGFGPTKRIVLWDTLADRVRGGRGEGRARARDRSPLERSHPEGGGLVCAAGDPGRVHRRARDAPARWDAQPGGRAARVADRGRADVAGAAVRELGVAPDGDRGGLEGACRRARSPMRCARCSSGSPRSRSVTRHRRGGRTS